MATRQYSIKNQKRDSCVCSSARVIDATLEPLTILKVLVEGLAQNAQTGLWLTNLTTGIPMVPRLSPFDLLYLDKNNRVLQGVELLPGDGFPAFKKPAVSALVLPLQSISLSGTALGDQLVFTEIEEVAPEPEEPAIEAENAELAPAEELQPASVSSESEAAFFELDACAPDRQEAAVQAEQEVVLITPREVERILSDAPRRFDEAVSSPEPAPVAIISIPERPVEEVHIERTSFGGDSLTPVVRSHARRQQIMVSGTERNGKTDPEAKEREAKEKDWMVSRFLRWLYPGAYESDRRKGRRIPIPNLVAYDTTTGVAQSYEVGDISATGMFLVTEERWPAGSLLSLSIQREGPQEVGTERRIQLQAGAVRLARNGVGLSFVMPDGMDLRLWEEPAKDDRRQSEPEYVVREFRMAKALAFINRISAPAVEESRYLIYRELSNVRAESTVNILLKAEHRLAQEEGGARMLAHPDLVVSVVEGGSWADSEWMQDLWAGLLVASCTEDGCDDSSLVFANLLCQLATIQTRIFAAICEKAVTVSSGGWVVSSEKIFSSAEEMAKMAGSHDMLKIHRSLAQLAEFGLLEKSVRASFVSEREGATTTPTTLGVRMYSRCLGRRGNP
jgi:hypothetical protein